MFFNRNGQVASVSQHANKMQHGVKSSLAAEAPSLKKNLITIYPEYTV